jgi:hypothetical protein
MKPKIEGNNIQLFVVQTVMKKDVKSLRDGNGKIVKDGFGKSIKGESEKFIREAYCKVWFDKNDIKPFGEYVGAGGKVLKNRTLIFSGQAQAYYKVAHSLGEMEDVLLNKTKIGY